jgi:hypothetical protein
MFHVCSRAVEWDMTHIAAETLESGEILGRRPRRRPSLVRFFALEGTMRVVIEADNEDDARYLCREMNWDFICLCDR